ncbi:PREDICTED: early nodulin-20-like [Nelumbo nucifera]|uniref:Early nodulin-20-like n=2 Tax=Nelumbo nucifera TaxID=4432 RepID=A0A1U7YNZ0_NELNU|nr:PREDICTED: early nodulin-20-like [Nelumbo nucifera]DAD22528.1 TPA_asm: hypothetical protein HUJ06_023991 [Nelumbo nucifera]
METSSPILIFLLLLIPVFQSSQAKIISVDEFAEWRNPTIHAGDSLVFKYDHHYGIYIFHNRRAFELCNFTEATLLNEPNSTSFTWRSPAPGYVYFSFKNGSLKACSEGEKLAIRVLPTPPGHLAPSPDFPPLAAPPPTSGGTVSSTPAYHWPFRSHRAISPSPAPTASPKAATIPSLLPDTGTAIPFINSNPAVPLPTGETDSATIRPLPTSGHGKQVAGLIAFQIPLCCMVWLVKL